MYVYKRCLTFVSLVAVSLWIGANWHASIHELEDAFDDAEIQQVEKNEGSPNIDQAHDHGVCPICQLGLASMDAPIIHTPCSSAELAQTIPCLSFDVVLHAARWTLPLGCGPPSYLS